MREHVGIVGALGALVAAVVACSGGSGTTDGTDGASSSGTGSSSGASGSTSSSSGVTSSGSSGPPGVGGCKLDTSEKPVDTSMCAPQVKSTTTSSCYGGMVCTYEVVVPCGELDAGASDGGTACAAACGSADAGAPTNGVCSELPGTAGQRRFQCGACPLGGGRPSRSPMPRRAA